VPFAAGLSEHPLTAAAVGEAAGQVLEQLGPDAPPPDLALLFVTPPHAGALEDAAAAVGALLHAGALLGCAAESVVGGDREVEERAGVSLWAGHTGPVTSFRLRLEPTPDGDALTGWPDLVPQEPSALLLLADPFSFPADGFLGRAGEDFPGLPVVGGMASAGRGPGGNRLVVDGHVVVDGAVGAFLGPGVDVRTVVSQGCRPVGAPFAVTRAERNIVYELAGRPALERLQDVARRASEDDRRLLGAGVHLGRVIDEQQVTYDRGDFLIRNLIGADPDNGAIAVADVVEVGQTAQFQVRDADSADEDLRALMTGKSAPGALVFTCNGRGSRLFGTPDHDAAIVADSLGHRTVAGMSCAGELGPVGGRNFLHGFTASVVLLADGGSSDRPRPAER
jgi:small ligand-binding sensory domain FIST